MTQGAWRTRGTLIALIALSWSLSGCSSPSATTPSIGGPINKLPDSVRSAFEGAAEVDLYSLDPWDLDDFSRKADIIGLHRWNVLGKTRLKGKEAHSVLEALDNGRRESDGKSYKCFEPRHAIQIGDRGHVYDIVLCYHCGNAVIYEGMQQIGAFTTAPTPAAFLNQVLASAKIPLAKTPAERR